MNDLSVQRARRIAVRAQLLDGSATSVLDTVRRLGFLQMDPISTVATPQQLVLFSRLGPFDPAELDRLLWKERKLFEYDAFIYPVEDLPLVRARMARRRRGGTLKRDQWVRDFLRENARLRRYILHELERNGPLLSRNLKEDVPAETERHAWWGRGPLRLMLDILAVRGDIAVAGRVGTHRLWDLGERVYPPSETLPWREAERELMQRRRRTLGVWKEKDGWKAHADAADGPVPDRVTVLSPFDRLIHDRVRSEQLFGFEYILEMYKPKDKRRWGYFALPVLHADRLVGKLDATADRKAGTLVVNAIHEDLRLTKAITAAVRAEIDDLAAWLGLEVTGA